MNYVTAKKGTLLIKIAEDKCDLCGCCVGICPEDALELTRTKLFVITQRCTNCAKCVWSCPVEAILFRKDGIPVE